MLKPTSSLLADIITFVINNQQVAHSLGARDNDQYTVASTINCRFFKKHPDGGKAAYLVDFTYTTRYDEDEANDDVQILVEVTDGSPPHFAIVNVRFY